MLPATRQRWHSRPSLIGVSNRHTDRQTRKLWNVRHAQRRNNLTVPWGTPFAVCRTVYRSCRSRSKRGLRRETCSRQCGSSRRSSTRWHRAVNAAAAEHTITRRLFTCEVLRLACLHICLSFGLHMLETTRPTSSFFCIWPWFSTYSDNNDTPCIAYQSNTVRYQKKYQQKITNSNFHASHRKKYGLTKQKHRLCHSVLTIDCVC